MQKKARFLVRHGGSALVPRVMSAGGVSCAAMDNNLNVGFVEKQGFHVK
jgi:hypothetical protein